MSEGWGSDAIPWRASGRPNLVEALSVAQHMPAEALDDAAGRPQAIAEAVLAVVARAAFGEVLTERDRNLLFWGVHVLGQVRDTRLFGPLIDLLRRPDDEDLDLFGVTLVLTVPTVVVGVFDGDADRLESMLADARADESARWVLFSAYAFLVFEGRIDRARAHAFLVRFDDERLARAGDMAWSGWESAIALLGFSDLAERRESAVAEARLLVEEEDKFRELLETALAEPDDPGRFAEHGIGDPEELLVGLEEALAAAEEADDIVSEEPARNPLRDVGRNDPCPCGSGRKFKKCCLGKDAP